MIYVKQIAPEYQESPLFLYPECFPENIAVCGNRNYNKHLPQVFERVQGALEDGEIAEALNDLKSSYYKNATQALNDLLPPEKARYSSRDINRLKTLVKAFAECRANEEATIICSVLSIVTGQAWEYRSITGSCQGEWQMVFYPVAAWSVDALNSFEIEYFNTGSEWIIHDEDGIPESPEDISGYSVYCTAWNEDGIKKELANAAGVDVSEIVMYSFERFKQVPVYKAV